VVLPLALREGSSNRLCRGLWSFSQKEIAVKQFVVVAVILAACISWGQAPNPVTNGSFEELEEGGIPLDWEIVGGEATVVKTAHDGERAVRLRRTAEQAEKYRETGLNRAWKIHSGEQGKMLDKGKGGLRFWYMVPTLQDGNAWL